MSVRVRLSVTLLVLLLGGSLFAQSTTSVTPEPNRQRLAGTWTLDKSWPPEDRKNWDRWVEPKGPFTVTVRPIGTVGPMNYEKSHLASLSIFGSKLIVESETLVIKVEPDGVTIDDDFREATRFSTTGQTGAIHAQRMKVSVKSSWNGDALVQELRTRDLAEIVRITRTFIPFEEGRKMLFVIKVLQPKLKDPVKDIERVYLRSSVPGAGSSVLWR